MRIKKYRKRDCYILPVTVWVLVILSIMVVSVGAYISGTLQGGRVLVQQLTMYSAARTSIVQGISDSLLQTEQGPQFKDSFSKEFLDSQEIDYDNVCVQRNIDFEDSKVNINIASPELIKELLEICAIEQTDNLVQAILAWRGDSESGLASEAYDYFGYGYDCKKGMFENIHEIELVKDFSKIELSKLKKFKELITIYGDGKISLNKVSVEVLTVLFKAYASLVDVEGVDGDMLAARVVEYRDAEIGSFATVKELTRSLNKIFRSYYSTEIARVILASSSQLKVSSNFLNLQARAYFCENKEGKEYKLSCLFNNEKEKIVFWREN